MRVYFVDSPLLDRDALPVHVVDRFVHVDATPIQIVDRFYPGAQKCYLADPLMVPNTLRVYIDDSPGAGVYGVLAPVALSEASGR